MSPEIADLGVSIAALLHFLQLPSMRLMRNAHSAELAALPTFTRAMLILFAGGIVACVTGIGAVLLLSHGQVLDNPLGRKLCLFLGVFWGLRGLAQWTLLGRIWPTHLLFMHRFLSVFYPGLGLSYLLLACTPR